MAKLRKDRTDQLLAAIDDARHRSADERVRKLLHELHGHAEIITTQNEELKRAQAELEEATSRYADLYDLAPIGYLTLNKGGLILDINIAGAALLGFDRPFAQGLPLTAAFNRSQRRRFREHLSDCWHRPPGQTSTFEVLTREGPERTLRFTCRKQGHNPASRLFATVVDITEERALESDRAAALKREQARGEELACEVAVRTRAEERIKALLARLVTVQEEERRRIALNLHDQLGQRLTALRLSVSALKEHRLSAAALTSRLDAIDRVAAQIDRDVDNLAWELRPAALDDMGLDAAVGALVKDWSGTQGLRAEFHVSVNDRIRLPAEIESHLYRIIQEALTNAGKHAAATAVSVILERKGDEVVVIIEDDGRGFEVEHVSLMRSQDGCMGLTGMQERAALIGGAVEIESTPGVGTTVFVRVPIRPASSPKA